MISGSMPAGGVMTPPERFRSELRLPLAGGTAGAAGWSAPGRPLCSSAAEATVAKPRAATATRHVRCIFVSIINLSFGVNTANPLPNHSHQARFRHERSCRCKEAQTTRHRVADPDPVKAFEVSSEFLQNVEGGTAASSIPRPPCGRNRNPRVRGAEGVCANAIASSAPCRETGVPVTGTRMLSRVPIVSCQSVPRAIAIANGPPNSAALRVISEGGSSR